jgi:hypothetical protein
MKRFIVCCAIGVVGLSGFIGCSEETKATKKETIQSPGGKTTITDEQKVQQSGKNPPKAP